MREQLASLFEEEKKRQEGQRSPPLVSHEGGNCQAQGENEVRTPVGREDKCEELPLTSEDEKGSWRSGETFGFVADDNNCRGEFEGPPRRPSVTGIIGSGINLILGQEGGAGCGSGGGPGTINPVNWVSCWEGEFQGGSFERGGAVGTSYSSRGFGEFGGLLDISCGGCGGGSVKYIECRGVNGNCHGAGASDSSSCQGCLVREECEGDECGGGEKGGREEGMKRLESDCGSRILDGCCGELGEFPDAQYHVSGDRDCIAGWYYRGSLEMKLSYFREWERRNVENIPEISSKGNEVIDFKGDISAKVIKFGPQVGSYVLLQILGNKKIRIACKTVAILTDEVVPTKMDKK